MPTDIDFARGTRFTFEPSGGDEPFTLTSLGAGAGRISDRFDLGAFPRPTLFAGSIRTRAATTPVVDEALYLRLVEWRTHRDTTIYGAAGLGATDAAVSDRNLIKHLPLLAVLSVNEASTTRDLVKDFTFRTFAEYISLVLWNDTADGLSATGTHHEVAVWPFNPQQQ